MGFDMQARGRDSAGQFWWRATEPIPARPEKLAGLDELDAASPAPVLTPQPPPADATSEPEAPRSTRFWSGSVTPLKPRAAPKDLGAYRPAQSTTGDDAPRQAPAAPAPMPAPAVVGLGRSVTVRHSRGRPRRALLRRRHALWAAGIAGALLFAGSTDFGRHVRQINGFSGELDQVLVATGLGINEISLNGHEKTSDKDVFRALAAGNSTLLTFDVGAARRRVEALPWVESATLARVFPDKLRVDLRERTPAAIWFDGDRVALVDASGRRLTYLSPSMLPEGLPRIAGAGAPEAAADLRRALARFPAVAARVALARRIGERRWDLELSNKAIVKLAAGDVEPSLERFVRLEEETRWLDQAGQVVDLTVPRTIAVSAPAVGSLAPRPSARPSSSRRL